MHRDERSSQHARAFSSALYLISDDTHLRIKLLNSSIVSAPNFEESFLQTLATTPNNSSFSSMNDILLNAEINMGDIVTMSPH